MKTPFDILRAVISAFTAALNADGKPAADKAQIEIDDLKAQLAAAQKQPAEGQGIPLTADEQAHVLNALSQTAAAPAIAVPPQPVAPNAPEPVSEPLDQEEPEAGWAPPGWTKKKGMLFKDAPLEPDHYPPIPAEATEAQKEQVAPQATMEPQPFIPPAAEPITSPEDRARALQVGDEVTVTKSFFGAVTPGDTGEITAASTDGRFLVKIGTESIELPADCLEKTA